ncbi:hypothetical protein ACLOJK_002819 [Asimina triloba]
MAGAKSGAAVIREAPATKTMEEGERKPRRTGEREGGREEEWLDAGEGKLRRGRKSRTESDDGVSGDDESGDLGNRGHGRGGVARGEGRGEEGTAGGGEEGTGATVDGRGAEEARHRRWGGDEEEMQHTP